MAGPQAIAWVACVLKEGGWKAEWPPTFGMHCHLGCLRVPKSRAYVLRISRVRVALSEHDACVLTRG